MAESLIGIPLWGQWSIVGALLALVLFVVTQLIRGELVSRSHLERERELAELWKDAWQKEREASANYAESVTRNVELVETLQAVLNALPPKPEPGHD